ncbi:MAG: NYN domain-containing protein [Ardenticatenales bacterium]
MAAQREVGLFIDFENIRYGMINNFGVEPDPQALMEKARKYGPVAVAYAYADFTQHPALYRRKLEVAGITPRDVPRRSPDVAHKSSADMAMLMDIIDCLLDRPYVQTLVLMTGDSDFIRVTARARHRFGKQVVISGVPGSVSSDLIESADAYDPVGDALSPVVASAPGPDEDIRLLQLVVWLAGHRPYMTFGFIRSHALSPHHGLGFSEDQVTDRLTDFKERGILIESYRPADDGRTLRTLELNADHPSILACRQLPTPNFEESRPARGGGTAASDADAADAADAADGTGAAFTAASPAPSDGHARNGGAPDIDTTASIDASTTAATTAASATNRSDVDPALDEQPPAVDVASDPNRWVSKSV